MAYEHALKQERSKLLVPKQQYPTENSGTVRVIARYDQRAEEAARVVKHFWDILKIDKDITDILPSKPQITYRRGRSLRDRLVHSFYTRPKRT